MGWKGDTGHGEFMEELVRIIKEHGTKKLEEILADKEVIRGGEFIHGLKKQYNLPQSDAEQLTKLFIGADSLQRVGKLTNIWDDLFKINKDKLFEIIIKGFSYPTEEIEKQERQVKPLVKPTLEIDTIKTVLERQKSIICVVSVPPVISFDIKAHGCISLNEAFKSLINSANRDIKIISPFIDKFGIVQYLYDLIDAANRGAEIKLLIRKDGGDSGRGIQHLCDTFSAEACRNMLEIRNFHMQRDEGQLYGIHAKLLIVDNTLGYIGSGEFRGNSLWGLVETGIITIQPVINPFIELFDQVWKTSDTVWKST